MCSFFILAPIHQPYYIKQINSNLRLTYLQIKTLESKSRVLFYLAINILLKSSILNSFKKVINSSLFSSAYSISIFILSNVIFAIFPLGIPNISTPYLSTRVTNSSSSSSILSIKSSRSSINLLYNLGFSSYFLVLQIKLLEDTHRYHINLPSFLVNQQLFLILYHFLLLYLLLQ